MKLRDLLVRATQLREAGIDRVVEALFRQPSHLRDGILRDVKDMLISPSPTFKDSQTDLAICLVAKLDRTAHGLGRSGAPRGTVLPPALCCLHTHAHTRTHVCARSVARPSPLYAPPCTPALLPSGCRPS